VEVDMRKQSRRGGFRAAGVAAADRRRLGRRLIPLVLALMVLPAPALAQQPHSRDWRLRLEVGPGQVEWWENPGLFVMAGAALAGSPESHFALDAKLLKGMGGDGPGSNTEGFLFALIGPEVRFQPASRVSPFLAAHVGVGSDEDGPMGALTGEAGVDVRTGQTGGVRFTGLATPGFEDWGVTVGYVLRLGRGPLARRSGP
jgi:hypothetical protein